MPQPSIPFTRWRGAKLWLNLPIPADLRPRFLTSKGTERTHIVESLGTGDPTKGRALAREMQAFWELEFAKLRRGHSGETPSAIRKARALREAMADAVARGSSAAVEAVENLAVDAAEEVEAEAGEEAGAQFYTLATTPNRLTLLEAMAKLSESDWTEGTKVKREQQLRDLLKFLQVPDCLPEYVTEARAVAYVENLNATKLGYTTKQNHLSALQGLWRFLARKRQLPHGVNPWVNHELTRPKKATEEGVEVEATKDKRGWQTDEILKLFNAPDHKQAKHYQRSLFRELYTLGFITGMRLDEIVSQRPETITKIKGGYVLKVDKAKTAAGVRDVPVVHPAAVAIISKRLQAQKDKKDKKASIFPECRPGGPDNKLSWHVQKALGRDRDQLGFTAEVDFHSTRRSFMTMMENVRADVIHVQRYVGHGVPTMMHKVYSDGTSMQNLRKVAAAVKYPAKVEALFAKAAGL